VLGQLFSKLFAVTRNQQNSRVLSNIFSLGALQAANYLFPLITAPYLIRVLGPEFYGLVAFSTATITYFALLTDYGFNLSATRQVALIRDDPVKRNTLFSSVMIVKALLACISFALLIILLSSIDKFGEHKLLYYVSFSLVIGQTLFPMWFFQGMETMKYITYVNVASKAIFTVAVFIFVQQPSDYLLVPLLTGLGSIVGAIWSLWFIKKHFSIEFSWQPVSSLHEQIKEGRHVFLSSVVMNLYTTSITFILGLFTNNTVVGYFAAADKVILAAKGLFTPVIQALYPMLSKKLRENQPLAMQQIKKISWGIGVYTLLASLAIWLMAEPIVNLLFGEGYQASRPILAIMAPLPFLIALSNIFGLLIMLNTGHKKAFTSILVASSIVGLILCFILIPPYLALGAAAVMLAVEALVTINMFIYLRYKKLL